jgi:hypothetical protein
MQCIACSRAWFVSNKSKSASNAKNETELARLRAHIRLYSGSYTLWITHKPDQENAISENAAKSYRCSKSWRVMCVCVCACAFGVYKTEFHNVSSLNQLWPAPAVEEPFLPQYKDFQEWSETVWFLWKKYVDLVLKMLFLCADCLFYFWFMALKMHQDAIAPTFTHHL